MTELFSAQSLWAMAIDVAKKSNESVCQDLQNVKGEYFVESTMNLLAEKKLYATTYQEIFGRIRVLESAGISDPEIFFHFLDAVRTSLFEAKTANETHAELLHIKPVKEAV